MLIKREKRKELAGRFESLKRQVTLHLFTQEVECRSCRENRALAEELAELSGKIFVEESDFLANGNLARKYGIDKIPALAVVSRDGFFCRFYGVPLGYQFECLVEAISSASAGFTPLDEGAKEFLAGLEGEVHIEVYATPTCPPAAAMVTLAQRMAFESKKVRADMVDIADFPQLAQKLAISSLPLTIINGKARIEGSVTEQALLAAIKDCL